MINWLHTRQFIAMRAKHIFSVTLQHRGFKGTIKFDHKGGRLFLDVEGLDKSRRSTHQLSGGERSYSTIAFLLSLWEALDNPFRALDEYDVFMDEVNRRLSTLLIIDTAKISVTRQFILISPLETYA